MRVFEVTEAGDEEDLLALGRMVSYACQRAKTMNLEFSTYCLEMAMMSLMQDLARSEPKRPKPEERTAKMNLGSGFH